MVTNSKIDLTFSVNPKETAYFLGFFWADGTINNGKYLVVEITQDDADSLKKVFSNVADFKITTRERKNRKPQTTFFLRDDITCETLKKLGKYPNSVEGHEKILNFLPEEYVLYFLRGLIDGDGCFYSGKTNRKWKNNTMHFTIGSRYDQDWDGLICYIEKKFGFRPRVIRRVDKKGNKSSIIRESNFSAIEKLTEILYKDDDGIYLKRKRDKVTEALREHKQNKIEAENRRKKFEIVFLDGSRIVTNNLKRFAQNNGFCYDCLSRASNGSHKYKGMTITQF